MDTEDTSPVEPTSNLLEWLIQERLNDAERIASLERANAFLRTALDIVESMINTLRVFVGTRLMTDSLRQFDGIVFTHAQQILSARDRRKWLSPQAPNVQ
jgi:hypothetical protein